jgi:transcriptional regulator with XRE-family HTH domain
MDVVLKLRELRRMRGLTQRQAAEKSGVGVKTISTFETGARIGSMHLDQFLSILAAYDVTPDEFFDGSVERAVFAELERLTTEESRLIRLLREVADAHRARLLPRLIAHLESLRATTLRAAS